ncbi:uncharacterized protein B0H18DRAFT_958293 [Fomitopsis serialis]|uniref:uncharacterized protein n=1 Tax=Fomitopsis serialis TaxID=139415 RepID=UPI002008BC7E|nr:uncharacterized protein B0H18DRAFT_958293 [Neoantrodia serialis]KAH9917630.1 hypothetical protein B0H18DRAFT_958293 [Neoantrodia serialis]
MLREWIPLQHNYLRSLYAHYTPPPLNAEGSYMCAGCNNGGGVWKCMSCIGYPIFCPTCCLAEHRRTPFHRVEQWNVGGYWEPAWLRQVGVSINLGHRGGECSQPAAVLDDDEDGEANRPANAAGDDEAEIPADPLHHADSPPRPPPAMMTIVDTSGVHFLPVTPCGCPWAGDHTSQLLMPGCIRRVSGRLALQDYGYELLPADTPGDNPAFPHEVPDRYLELLRVSREWALLQAKKQFGYGPQWRGAPGNGDLAHFCPACPQPGVNIPADWEVDDRKYLYARGYVMDGNFHAEQMKMRKPENDVPLMPGKMFMVHPGPYEEHLKVAKDVKMHSSCNDHKAVSQANADRHKLAVTGIGATSCLRHGCFLPHSVVNYQKGERQMNMDYSLSNALGYRSRGLGTFTSRLSLIFGENTGLTIDSGIAEKENQSEPPTAGGDEGRPDREGGQCRCRSSGSVEEGTEDSTTEKASGCQVPSRLELQIKLAEEEGEGEDRVGTADWIADGLKLEEQQLGIQKDVKKMGAIVTRPQELKLAKRRKTLEIQIRRFHRRAAAIHRRHNWGIAEQDAVEDDSGMNGRRTATTTAHGASFQVYHQLRTRQRVRAYQTRPTVQFIPECTCCKWVATIGGT